MTEVTIREFVPVKLNSTNPRNKTRNPHYDNASEYSIGPKFIRRKSDNFRICNMPSTEHHEKWYSSHDENGDAYWCPDCDDMQVG